MEQAVSNLVINAIKYSDSGSEVKVWGYETDQDGKEMLAISVQDYGVGIGKEHLPRLFERFYRSDKARSRKLGGTGLGLAIVKHIAQAHKGSVTVESEIGKGSVFTILLPLHIEEMEEEDIPSIDQ
jgi:two-component system phosphate regulon sensor histidine kinase PhoR